MSCKFSSSFVRLEFNELVSLCYVICTLFFQFRIYFAHSIFKSCVKPQKSRSLPGIFLCAKTLFPILKTAYRLKTSSS